MSMPVIKPSQTTRCQAIAGIIESVALEETAMARVLDGEGRKIQKAISFAQDNDSLLIINKSVQTLLNSVTRLQTVLQSKLELFDDCICDTCCIDCSNGNCI